MNPQKFDLSTLARNLLPFLKPLLQETSGATVAAGTPSPHGLNSAHHSGTLSNSQAPQFLLTNGGRALTGNLSVSAGVTIDGVDLSAHVADPNAHHNAVTVAGGLILSGQQLTVGVGNGTALSGTSVVVELATNSGLTFSGGDLTLGTPGAATVSSSNAVSTSTHTHAVTSSSNPGAAASLLASNASGYLQLTRLGLGVAPTVPLQARLTTEQLRLDYDASNYASFTVGSGGNLTLAPTGDLILDPVGNDVLPSTGYDLNLGSLQKKYLTLHAAELWVETLVAQDTIATIGGRILVGPTTTLIADLASGSTTIDVKHNQMSLGDVVYMEADGKVEFMQVTSAASAIAGGYRYSITRNLDGSGANQWYAGDAVFNTGTTGDGFIDLYSVQGVAAGSSAGPTIVGNVRRNSGTYNDWMEHWAIGNLKGLYGYGVDTYGVGLGQYGTSAENYLTVDATNGLRFFSGSTVHAQLTGTTWTMGSVSGGEYVKVTSSGIEFYGNAVKTIELTSAGNAVFGQVAANQGNAFWNASNKRMEFRGGAGGTVVQAYVDTDGAIVAGAGDVWLDAGGFSVAGATGAGDLNSYKFDFGGATYSRMTGFTSGGISNFLRLETLSASGLNGAISLVAAAPTTKTATALLSAQGFGTSSTLTLESNDSPLVRDATFQTDNLMLDSANARLFINDTANANMTVGLTINQGANDDEILAFKSSDVAHGITTFAETDTFGTLRKHSATEGGVRLWGLTEGGIATALYGMATTEDTGKSTTANANVIVRASLKSGTTEAAHGANANLFAVRSAGNNRFIVDQEGDIHMDATSNINAWDDHNDIALLAGVREAMNPGLRLAEFVEEARPVLERTGVVTYNPDGHHFISLKKLHALEIDAMRQLYQRIEFLEKRLEALQ